MEFKVLFPGGKIVRKLRKRRGRKKKLRKKQWTVWLVVVLVFLRKKKRLVEVRFLVDLIVLSVNMRGARSENILYAAGS